MACCLTAPSHYLNQCWVLIREVLWHSLESNFTIRTQITFIWIIPSVWIWGYVLHVEHISCVIIVACLAHFMCHFELWPTSVSHPFSSLNSPLGLSGEKHYQNITIPIFRLIIPNFAFPSCFPDILFCCYPFSLYFAGWFVIAVCGFISVTELAKSYCYHNLM